MSADCLAGDEEWVDWRWADGRVDRLPAGGFEDDLPGEEVASLGTASEGLIVTGSASRLHRLGPDLWLATTGDLDEKPELEAFRGQQEDVLVAWLPDAAAYLGHFADLPAFVACRLHGLLEEQELDAAVLADVEAAAQQLACGGVDSEREVWTGVMMFLDLRSDLAVSDELRRICLDNAPWVEKAVAGDPLVLRVLKERVQAWDGL